MPDDQTINDFVVVCRETRTTGDLWQNTLAFLKSRRIAMVSYHSDDAQLPGSRHLGIVAEGFPDQWVCQYIEKGLYKIDPIPELSSLISRPFKWSEAPMLTKLTKEGEQYIETLRLAGLGDGLAISVYGPKMRNAFMGLGFGDTDPDFTTQEIFELQCGVQIAHIRYCELTEDRQVLADPLSPREVEVLQWIARGKSNSVIAEILGVSRHTVDTLTRRIYEKLEVNDRTTAAIRGLGSGLVRHRRGAVV